ncbi:MAG: dTDP-4-dehydrorhamnose 3,5-epimerase [Rhodospirillaceae bacterium]|nr:dTDP-4-dehydrorhamnose 3,5-epimerase [Rhodospirillaceae bacterium]
MSRFEISDSRIEGLKVIQRHKVGDSRGFLSRLFCQDTLSRAGWGKPISQINHTFTSRRGTVRGMHFQHPPRAEAKLVTCLVGAIWDVAVDIRTRSPTFGQWHAVELTEDNAVSFLIPEGFAHGFQALSDNVQMLYCHSEAYAPDVEGGLNPLDPRLNIKWPLALAEISQRDQNHPMLSDAFKGVDL